jgi:hypothetical protein
MKRVMITGSTGRIGQDICKLLQDKFILIPVNSSTILTDDLFTNIDTIIHLAGKTPCADCTLNDYIDANVIYTQKVLNFANRNTVKKVLVTSSWSWQFKLGDYQYSKLLQEKIVNFFSKNGLSILTLELPEVQTSKYDLIRSLSQKANSQKLIVDELEFNMVSSSNLAEVFKTFINEGALAAIDQFDKIVSHHNLYAEVLKQSNVVIHKGIKKSRLPSFDGTAYTFPDYDV